MLERQHDRHRNLVVAATGTGKTIVAAFDYRATCEREGGRPRMLFVAHREEILKQARRTWREVLRDHSFGELLVGGAELQSYDHVFATINSVTSRGLVERCGSDFWHTVIIDECHHMAAGQFDSLVHSVEPRILLGLTATPERTDGQLISSYFKNRPDGSPAVELRLWHALDLQLLSPFEYFGYNEGVDLPSVDTLLLLRPTQSPVLFQQQLGRGLRLFPGKESCLVLDFVGRHRTEFRFDRLFSSITGLSRGQLIDAVEKGFSSLPPGCHIQLQQQTREQVLRSLRVAVNQTRRRLQAELQSYVALQGWGQVGLAKFLREQSLELDEIYRRSGRSGWTALRRDAGLLQSPDQPEDEYFGRRFLGLLHIDDPEQLDLLTKVADPSTEYRHLGKAEQQRLQMLAYQIDGNQNQIGLGEAFLGRLHASHDIREELNELGRVLQSKHTLMFHPIPGLEDTPLCLHAAYGSREILTAVEWLTPERRMPFKAGVLALHHRRVELLFVTLDKSAGFHDRIAYHDYAISTERFHWQSQNSAGPGTTAGKRYVDSPRNGWTFQLFVRQTKGAPYRACGPVELESHLGSKPMSIVWKLKVPLPARLFQEFSVLRGS